MANSENIGRETLRRSVDNRSILHLVENMGHANYQYFLLPITIFSKALCVSQGRANQSSFGQGYLKKKTHTERKIYASKCVVL